MHCHSDTAQVSEIQDVELWRDLPTWAPKTWPRACDLGHLQSLRRSGAAASNITYNKHDSTDDRDDTRGFMWTKQTCERYHILSRSTSSRIAGAFTITDWLLFAGIGLHELLVRWGTLAESHFSRRQCSAGCTTDNKASEWLPKRKFNQHDKRRSKEVLEFWNSY